MHLDMDAFYAAIEQVDNPAWRGRPVIVGGLRRGVVAAASYEARRYGIFSAMPMAQARRLCPHGVFLPVRLERYQEVSRQVMTLVRTVSPVVEQVSIDEAYIDLNGTAALPGSAVAVARQLKEKIRAATGLTCSIGLAPNKLLAKIASDLHKPDGLTVVTLAEVPAFLQQLPLGRLPGVGPKTLMFLQDLGLVFVGDILKYPPEFWRRHLGRSGLRLYERAQGKDDTPVVPGGGEPKSYSSEKTLEKDTADPEVLREHLRQQAERLGQELREDGQAGRTITLKIKFADSRQLSRRHTLGLATNHTHLIYHTAVKLLSELKLRGKVRLVGLGVANLEPAGAQGRLLADPALARQERLDQALDRIRKRFGPEAIRRGVLKKIPR